MCSIQIGGETAEFLRLILHARSLPNATDFWDGNWLECTAEVAAGAFQGKLDQALRTDELESFHQQLAVLYERLTGEAVLDAIEEWLQIRVVGDGRGHLEASCRLCEDSVRGNTLDCRLCFDQTFLPAVLRQLEAALRTFPVIGR